MTRPNGLTSEHPQDWKLVALMLNELGDETVYKDVWAVTAEIAEKVSGYGEINRKAVRKIGVSRSAIGYSNGTMPELDDQPVTASSDSLKLRIVQYLFAHDKILDAESKLAHQFKPSTIHLHESDASMLGVKAGDEVTVTANGSEVKAEVAIDNRCNPGGVVLPRISDEQGVMNLVASGQPVSWVKIKK